MNSTYYGSFSVSVFGESHGPAVGVVIDGLPAGLPVDLAQLQAFLDRRKPSGKTGSTARKESDVPEILSGVYRGFTTGTPLTAILRNEDAKPQDYDRILSVPRPGHADLTAQLKYGGFQDSRGGGHFSGRLTAPLCIAGGLCLQFLKAQGVEIHAKIDEIGGQTDEAQMEAAILAAQARMDSVGGVISCSVSGLPAGLGGPLFGGLEGRVSQAIFAIPAVKGLEFGEGFAAARLCGSQQNDDYGVSDGSIVPLTNHAGGILGGISSGAPLTFRVAVKPTPSIGLPQRTVDLETLHPETLELHGRHDVCIVPRAVPCVEAAAALAIYDAFLERKKEL